MAKLGRNWYRVTWQAPTAGPFPDEEWLSLFGDIPIAIDVLAKNSRQAIAICKSCYDGLEFCYSVTAYLVGTERQFQELEEPAGEVNLDLLPF